jgi:Transglycosylase SLT domain
MTPKIGITTLSVIITIPVLIAALTQATFSALVGASTSQPSPAALTDIPPDYLALYRTAATICPGLDWSVLAGIGKVETNHGRLNAPGVHSGENQSRAGGPMQFLQTTFDSVTSRHTIPPGGANPPSRYDPHDAIYAAAYYLCDNGARRSDLHAAIFAYNHADWYVHKVLNQATHYAVATTVGTGDGDLGEPARQHDGAGHLDPPAQLDDPEGAPGHLLEHRAGQTAEVDQRV